MGFSRSDNMKLLLIILALISIMGSSHLDATTSPQPSCCPCNPLCCSPSLTNIEVKKVDPCRGIFSRANRYSPHLRVTTTSTLLQINFKPKMHIEFVYQLFRSPSTSTLWFIKFLHQ
ncbi:hypothetical protein ACOSP7_001552 [Xanthoceras sorbifolium]